MRRAIILFLALVAGLSAALYFRLRAQSLESTRPSGGSATIEGTQTDVVPRISARIATLSAQEGDLVKAGQVLVTLECAEAAAALAQAEAQAAAAEAALPQADLSIELAKAALSTARLQAEAAEAAAKATRAQRHAITVQRKAAQRQTNRLATLQEAGVATEAALDQSRTQVDTLARQIQALVASASAADAQSSAVAGSEGTAKVQQQMAEARAAAARKEVAVAKAAVERARVTVAECTIRAPHDGVVQVQAYEPGEVVMPGARIMTLVDVRTVKATFYLPNAELDAAAPGRKVVVVADAYEGDVFEGTIRRVGTSAEFTPRNVQTRQDRDRLVYAVEIRIPNPEGKLRPGMPIEVTIPGTATEPK